MLKTAPPRSRVKHSTTEPLRSRNDGHTKPLKLNCFTEPHLAFAFMHKSFATKPRFYAQVICNLGFFIYTCEQQWNISFICWVLKRTVSLRRYFLVPATYVLVKKHLKCIFPFLKLFLSIVTVLINSRERQHNYQNKLPWN